MKTHNISAEEFKKYVFFTHVINGVQVSLKGGKNVAFQMTGADANKSVGDWAGEGLAKVRIDDKTTITKLMAHPLFSKDLDKGQIHRLPSPAEMEYRKDQIKGLDFINRTKESLSEGIVTLDLEALSKDKTKLQSLANKCGISAFHIDEKTFVKKKEKTVNELKNELAEVLNLGASKDAK